MKKSNKASKQPIEVKTEPKQPIEVKTSQSKTMFIIATEQGHLETGKRYEIPVSAGQHLISIGHAELANE